MPPPDQSLLYWGLGLLAVSLLLLVLEGFIPSAGLLGGSATLAALVGVVLLFRYQTGWGVAGLLTIGVLGPLAFIGALKMMPSTSFGRSVLGETPEEERAERELAERDRLDRRRALVGLRGRAVSDMHPVGEVDIEGTVVEALAEGPWIEAGAAVVVTQADGMQVTVRGVA